MANKNKSKGGIYHLAAAYTHYMPRNLSAAKEELQKAKTFSITNKEKEQYDLTQLLVLINEQQSITPQFEQELLPSIKSLRDKALNDKAVDASGYSYSQWQVFYRNFFSEILSKKYHAQKDFYKEALCVGAAESIHMGSSSNNYESQGTDFMHNKLISFALSSLSNGFQSKTVAVKK